MIEAPMRLARSTALQEQATPLVVQARPGTVIQLMDSVKPNRIGADYAGNARLTPSHTASPHTIETRPLTIQNLLTWKPG